MEKNNSPKKKKNLLDHLVSLGFTNRLAVYLIALLIFGLIAGLYLAILSIRYNYTGQLICWTAVFSPIGTAISIVLGKIVDKSRAENVGGNGDGISYAAAKAKNFNNKNTYKSAGSITGSKYSPGI